MAGRVAEFLTGTLRHANGLPVECIFPESYIGGAAQVAELFAREGVGVSITVTAC
jgi:L-fucose isomerase